ncbi:hypothetical protein H7200_00385 [Candidatus Saccharibacteria bacterium]|nr:hypothetical protein [Candidatus Saccharibacteria bacterium]
MPTTPTSLTPEEDATLLAIESLEARSVDAPTVKPVARPVVTPAIKPIGPVVVPPAPISASPAQPKIPPITAPINDVASAIAAALASAPAQSKQSRFNPFAHQKISKKPFIVITIILLVAGLVVGGYFALTLMQSS